MISTVSALLLTIVGRILLNSAEKEVTSDYKYVTYSQIRRPKSSVQITQLLTEIEYPVSKADLWQLAKQQGASHEDLTLLENLPNRLYQEVKELEKEFK